MKQRAVIIFNAKFGKTALKAFQLMQQKYGTDCLSQTNVFLWHKRFFDGRKSLEDVKRTGRPISIQTSEMFE